MSHSNIVICMTGSIAAYKACELVSSLKKLGHNVKVIMSQTATKFVGTASLQSLSGHPVFIDDFSEDSMMSHIELGRWCDATLVYPASAQTINSFASGIGHELHNAFFLAYDFRKPFLIAPAMNTRMLDNPVTKKSIKTLRKIGCEILDTQDGALACGEHGAGRLIEPDRAIERLRMALGQPKKPVKRVLITAGGTRETIDGVRTLTNMSTGKTGAALADHLYERGHQVLLLTNEYAEKPQTQVKMDTYNTFRDIYNTLKALAQTQNFDMILHAAAISDYSIANIKTPDGEITPSQEKMSSDYDNISIQLKRNEKILPRLKDLFGDQTTVVGFKLTSTESKKDQAKAIFSLFTEKAVDYVIHNDMNDIKNGNRKFLMTSREGEQNELDSIDKLAEHISNKLNAGTREVLHDLMS
jgi:phosphopantothenoylcysteine decarboxylase/phosphopantothenate--cysteine ligase